jgi:periplasmic protein TonB
MEVKKNPKANLEKYKLTFLGISLLLSISFLILAFGYETTSETEDFSNNNYIIEEDMTEITRQDELQAPPEQPEEHLIQQNNEIIEIVADNTVITEEVNINFEEFDENEGVDLEETTDEPDDQIFVYVQKMPQFPGGDLALRKYIADHIVYPPSAKENGIVGTVYMAFEVTKTGKVGKVEIRKGTDPLLDEEALNVIKTLPDFIPGEQNGKKVNVWYSIPVTFKLH